VIIVDVEFIHPVEHIKTFLNLPEDGMLHVEGLQVISGQRDVKIRVVLVGTMVRAGNYSSSVMLLLIRLIYLPEVKRLVIVILSAIDCSSRVECLNLC